MRVLILHGWGGSDYPHWQAKLASKIACNYGTVSFPLLPNPHFPTLQKWLEALDKQIKEFKPTVIVCHSLACNLWFWYANRCSYKLDKLYLVAIPSLNTKEKTISTFFPCPKPKSLNTKELFIVASTDDPWCSTDEVEELSKLYSAELKIMDSAGHINEDSGYGDWDWIEGQFNLKRKCKE